MSAPAPAPSPAAAPRHASGNAWRRLSGAGVYLFVIALLLAGRALSPDFWSWDKNLLLVLQDVSILGIVAVGLAFVTCSGNYVDLSIPAIMAIAGIVAVYLLPFGLLPAAAAGLVVGTLLGLINGWVVGCLRANPILWTMAAMAMADGITRWAYGGKWQYVDAAAPTGRVFAALYGGKAFGVDL